MAHGSVSKQETIPNRLSERLARQIRNTGGVGRRSSIKDGVSKTSTVCLKIETAFSCRVKKDILLLIDTILFYCPKDEHTSKYKAGACHYVASFSEISSPRHGVELSFILPGTSMNPLWQRYFSVCPNIKSIITYLLYNKANN